MDCSNDTDDDDYDNTIIELLMSTFKSTGDRI